MGPPGIAGTSDEAGDHEAVEEPVVDDGVCQIINVF